MTAFYKTRYVVGYPIEETHSYSVGPNAVITLSIREETDFGRDKTDETREFDLAGYLKKASPEAIAAMKVALGTRVQWDDYAQD
jgi:hypothetical protein